MNTWYPTAVHHSSDRVPPKPPQVACVLVWRGWGEHGAASEQSCLAHRGFIQFQVKPGSDNETPVDKLGFRFEYIDGTMPEGLTVFPTCYALPPTAELYLVWDDGVTWAQDAFCFRVAVRAIDQAGNQSARSNVLIVGNGGNMEYTHRMVDGSFSLLSMDKAAQQAKIYSQRKAAVVIDTMRVAGSSTLQPPVTVDEVYDDATLRAIQSLNVARIDRVASHYPAQEGDIPFTLEPYFLTETGRDLSRDEIRQLRELLLDPHSYILDHWACGSSAEYAVTAGADNDKTYVIVDKQCLGVSIRGPGFQHGRELTREAGSLLRAYCEGLFRLPRLKS